ncbi:glycosyltransferase family 1 protein [Backusella circina FSU 941]|nr:glycosyltransferase family 1 protein [Backusella circina FSU 941]
MRFQTNLLLFLSVLLLSNFSTAEGDNLLSLTETYFQPKNIGFVCAIGGSSHTTWVLTILDELADRGHNVTFLTKDDGVRFGKRYPRINTVSIGPDPEIEEEVYDSIEERDNILSLFIDVIKGATSDWEKDYYALIDYFKTNKFDTVICDSFLDTCRHAAVAADIPFIITSDTSAPYINNNGVMMDDYTTEFVSLSKRFYDKFIFPANIIWNFYESFQDLSKRKKDLGITGISTPAEDSSDSIKLINNYFGMTPARPLGPLVEQVGPIIPRKYEPLTAELEEYLDSHKRVAYVSFGQHAKPSPKTVNLILAALIEVCEAGDLDGIIWAGSMTSDRLAQDIVTASGKTYPAAELLENKNVDIRFVKWAPQLAVLSHPSTRVFVSHGGFGSCIEAIYKGVRMIFFPVFGDQPGNSVMIERAKTGGVLRSTMTIPEAVNIIKKIVVDDDGEVEKNLKRMQAIAQIRSRNGAKMGADVVEEVAFSHVDGKVPHRYEASRNISFIKAHNIDLYTILGSIILSIRSVLKPNKKTKTQ